MSHETAIPCYSSKSKNIQKLSIENFRVPKARCAQWNIPDVSAQHVTAPLSNFHQILCLNVITHWRLDLNCVF